MPAPIDLAGQRFGRLTAIRRVGTTSGHALWSCHCECGELVEVPTPSLRSGKTKSCGCIRREIAASQASVAGAARGLQMHKHGDVGTRLYNVWKAMRQRCSDPGCKDYPNYGGRGITICPEWDDYTAFRSWALASGYDSEAPRGVCTIDRTDVDGDYCPTNCRWVDSKTQANNKRKVA